MTLDQPATEPHSPPVSDAATLESQTSEPHPGADDVSRLVQDVEAALGTVIVGQADLVRGVVVALLAGGNVLMEGVPGLGKTLLIRTLADVIDAQFARIQFTPDLMPADITGTVLIDEKGPERRFRFEPGPLFANLVLADEINRATPKTQSALLEAMQEHAVTVAGERHQLPEPFFVLATQNPLEMAGTYPLPEAQLDRFLVKLHVPFPAFEELVDIAERTTSGQAPVAPRVTDADAIGAAQTVVREVPTARHVTEHAARVVMETHPGGAVGQSVRFGAGPRGVQSLLLCGKARALLEGRFNVALDDIDAVAPQALRHRIGLTFEAETEGILPDDLVAAAVVAARRKTDAEADVAEPV